MVSVEIYIKTPFYNGTPITADSDLYTADDTTITADATDIIDSGYTYAKLDLFKDEKISVTSSIQNVNDLSKVFTDYSQSFTVPASKNNNQIFNYWNESAVNNGFDQRIRYDAIIEINTIPFKKGQIQIEKANEKDNRIESYSITFYGKVKQLKDLFKEDKLNVLDYSSLNHPYTYTEIRDRIKGDIEDDITYPLVGNQHKYEYNTGGVNDVTVGGSLAKSIVYTDLFPAITVSKVFEFMQSHYGITFNSTLFDTSYWKDLFLYCKNVEQQQVYTEPVKINFTSTTGTMNLNLNLTTDEYTFTSFQSNGTTPTVLQSLSLFVSPTNNTIPYRIKVRTSNGTLVNVYDNLLGNTTTTFFNDTIPYPTASWYFEIESLQPLTFTTLLFDSKFAPPQLLLLPEGGQGISSSQSTSSIINIGDYIPDIKVSDFFNGIIKLFNLTITSTGENSFNLEPLEFYYAYGNYIDINDYVINDNVDIERTKLFKKLSFSHEKSENILNNYFRNTFQRKYDYGDLIYEDDLSNESTTYEIKSPFEDVMWERAGTGTFQTTSLIDKDLNPYKPKPILMYNNGKTTLGINIKLFDGTNYNNINRYVRFSNELNLNNNIASLNFGEEQSSYTLNNLASDSLFNLWYRNYISGLYDIRCRVVKLKAIMPITKLSDIKLNDKIVYKDKKYIINQFTTDLTSGEVDFELISDFRTVTNSANGTDRFALKQLFRIRNSAQDLEVTILKLNSEYYDVEYAGTSYESLDNYADGTFIVPIDANTTGDPVYKQIEITYHNPDIKQYINIIQNA
jgi:hypothetical protein